MNGGITLTNIRRIGVPASRKGRANPAYREAVEGFPTEERIAKAGGDYAIGGDDRTGKRHHMQDIPLDRALKKKIISGAEHSALEKYRHHWYHAGQAPHIGSVDLNRIFSAEPGGVAGMPRSEAQVFHRQQWREAFSILGHRPSIVVDNVVCHEHNLEIAGYSVGYHSQPSAIRGAGRMLSEAGALLARFWGIG